MANAFLNGVSDPNAAEWTGAVVGGVLCPRRVPLGAVPSDGVLAPRSNWTLYKVASDVLHDVFSRILHKQRSRHITTDSHVQSECTSIRRL
ncbi:hypothetical protein BIW11_04968 [Tropilaelaps mercedesae]|uniref:Uncharacterized protein n=1 Tax=Tropilaelaps mercedesae TaxID=418985 RepID=A0A1V9WZB5_9ACAR|nr:hypothetical protein BIW11_04968 [Tropilaelaps mercedesae]